MMLDLVKALMSLRERDVPAPRKYHQETRDRVDAPISHSYILPDGSVCPLGPDPDLSWRDYAFRTPAEIWDGPPRATRDCRC